MTGAFLSECGWLIAAAVLLALELVLPGVFLLFFGLAAAVVGINVLVLGADGFFGFGQQVLAFLVLTCVFVLLGRHRYGAKDQPASGVPLNRRAETLVDRTGPLVEAIVAGRGRMSVLDGGWMVEGPDLPAGSQVRIVGSRGTILIVEPVDPPPNAVRG